jgi:hypothetical protein
VTYIESALPSGVTVQRRPDLQPMPAAFGEPLPDHVLERIAVHWAAAEQVPPTHVIMREEDLGYAIWAPGRRAQYATFFDKVTGRRVGYANPNHQDKQYANQLEREDGLLPRPGFGGPEVDPPAVVAEASLAEADTHIPRVRAVSARTGEPPTLHPAVAARLTTIPLRSRVRGAERHAELIALSRALEAADAARAETGRPGITAADLDGTNVRAFVQPYRIRDPGDPRTCALGTICATCAQVAGTPHVDRPDPGPYDRMVARARLHLSTPEPAAGVLTRVAAVAGVQARHEPSRAADLAVQRYFGKRWDFDAPGRAVRSTPFSIDPMTVADSADTLARVAGRLGASLFPLGSAGTEGILAIAPDHRVVLIDDAGEWLLGRGARRALDTLLLGRPAARLA